MSQLGTLQKSNGTLREVGRNKAIGEFRQFVGSAFQFNQDELLGFPTLVLFIPLLQSSQCDVFNEEITTSSRLAREIKQDTHTTRKQESLRFSSKSVLVCHKELTFQ